MTQWQLLADDLWGVKKIYAFLFILVRASGLWMISSTSSWMRRRTIVHTLIRVI